MNKKLLIYRYVLLDFLAATIVWVLFMMFRRVVNDGVLFENITILVPNSHYFTNLALFPLFSVFIHYITGYYINPFKQSSFIEFLKTLLSTVFISIIIFFVLLLDDIVISYEYYYYSLLVLIVLLFTITFLLRLGHSLYILRKFKKGDWKFNTLIIGVGEKAESIANQIEKTQYLNQVVGFVNHLGSKSLNIDQEKILGSMYDIDKIIEKKNISEVVVALDEADETVIFNVLNKLFYYNIDISFLPRPYEILTGKVRIQNQILEPLVSVTKHTMSDWELAWKRFFDLSFSLFSLIFFSPLFLIISIAIKLDSKGSVFYRQTRIGLHGVPFKILKFRTMHSDSERGKPQLSSPTDSRVTNMGRILRKYRLDELPQFVNIIKGEMSIVGPRPEREYYINQIIKVAPYYCLLYRIRPGLTSWGPIKLGYADTVDKMIERLNYDILYLENMSIFTDLKIMLSTIKILIRGEGV